MKFSLKPLQKRDPYHVHYVLCCMYKFVYWLDEHETRISHNDNIKWTGTENKIIAPPP